MEFSQRAAGACKEFSQQAAPARKEFSRRAVSGPFNVFHFRIGTEFSQRPSIVSVSVRQGGGANEAKLHGILFGEGWLCIFFFCDEKAFSAFISKQINGI